MAGQGKQTSAERRKEKAAEARAKAQAESRKRRMQVIGGTLAIAVVGGGVFAGVATLTKGESEADRIARVTERASDTPQPTIDQTGVAEGMRKCSYPKGADPASKDVGMPPDLANAKGLVYATFVTNKGTIQVEMDRAAAPCTVNSFAYLASKGYYDDTPCHRLLDESGDGFTNAVLQCGDPTGKGTGGPGYSFPDENLAGAKYPRGIMAMANAGPNTNGSQFFWMFKNSDFSPDYVPFGKILSGIDVIAKIAAGGRTTNPTTGADDVPKTKTQIEKVTVSDTKPSGIKPDKPESSAKPDSTAKPESTEKPKS